MGILGSIGTGLKNFGSDLGAAGWDALKGVGQSAWGIGAGLTGQENTAEKAYHNAGSNFMKAVGSFGEAPTKLPLGIGTAVEKLNAADAQAYKQGISRPIATSFLFTDMGQDDESVNLFNADAWKRAWSASEDVSPGQAAWLNIRGATDEAFGDGSKYDFGRDMQTAKSGYFDHGAARAVTGLSDAVVHTGLDPLAIAGKGAEIARLRYTGVQKAPGAAATVEQAARQKEDLLGEADRYANSGRFDKMVKGIQSASGPDELRLRYFNDNADGASVAVAAFGARHDPDLLRTVARLAKGDMSAQDDMLAYSAALAKVKVRKAAEEQVSAQLNAATARRNVYETNVKAAEIGKLDPSSPNITAADQRNIIADERVRLGIDKPQPGAGAVDKNYTPVDEKLIDSVAKYAITRVGKGGNVSARQVADQFHVSRDAATKILAELETRGVVTAPGVPADGVIPGLQRNADYLDWRKPYSIDDQPANSGAPKPVRKVNGPRQVLIGDVNDLPENDRLPQALNAAAIMSRISQGYQAPAWLERVGATTGTAADWDQYVAQLQARRNLFDQLTVIQPDILDAVKNSLITTADSQVRPEWRNSWSSAARVSVHNWAYFGSGPVVLRRLTQKALLNNTRVRAVDLNDRNSDRYVRSYLERAGSKLTGAHQASWQQTQQGLLNLYLASTTTSARQLALVQAESEVIRQLGRSHGLDEATTRKVIDKAAENRNRVLNVSAAKQAFASADLQSDWAAKSIIHTWIDADGNLQAVDAPALSTQLADRVPLVDPRQLDDAIALYKDVIADQPRSLRAKMLAVNGTASDALDQVHSLWKPQILIGFGWPVRALSDEVGRRVALFGLLPAIIAAPPGARDAALNAADRAKTYAKAYQFGHAEGRRERMRTAKKEIAQFNRMESRGRGRRGVTVDTVNGPEDFEGAFEGLEGANFRALASSEGMNNSWLVDSANVARDRIGATVGFSDAIMPQSPDYAGAWEHAVNAQLANDWAARQYLMGRGTDDIVAAAKSTVDGRKWARETAPTGSLYDRLERVEAMAKTYVPDTGNGELRKQALSGRATIDDLNRTGLSDAEKPQVHGAMLQHNLGKGPVWDYARKAIDQAMRKLSTTPSDVASRHPFFAEAYQRHLDGLVQLHSLNRGGVTQAEKAALQTEARQRTLADVRKWLFNSDATSDAAATLRHFIPFGAAYADAMRAWGGILVREKPHFFGLIQQVWQAPEKAGLIYDQDGNQVRIEDGKQVVYVMNPETGDVMRDANGRKVKAANQDVKSSDKQVYMQLPSWATPDSVFGKGTRVPVHFSKNSLNTFLNLDPGAGPVVGIPANEIEKHNPELSESAISKWVLPFGPQGGPWFKPFMSNEVRSMYEMYRGEDDATFRNQSMMILQSEMTKYNLGERSTKPTLKEASGKARKMKALRILLTSTLPVSPNFDSPYQPYVDAYRRLEKDDPGTADARFIDEFGDEYFYLTARVTKNVAGIPPTIAGYKKSKQYQDLVDKYPKLAGVVLGDTGGSFNKAVYEYQKLNGQRKVMTPQESIEELQAREGRVKYQSVMDVVRAKMDERNISDINDWRNRDVKAARDAIVDKLKHNADGTLSEWYKDYSIIDRSANEQKIEGLKAIAANKDLANRDDIAGLAQYLTMRDDFMGQLQHRSKWGGAKTISADANWDINHLWTQGLNNMLSSNLAFQALYDRYLPGDTLEVA